MAKLIDPRFELFQEDGKFFVLDLLYGLLAEGSSECEAWRNFDELILDFAEWDLFNDSDGQRQLS